MSDTRAVSAAVIALKVSGRIIGILNFSKNEQYSWNQDDQKLLKAIASMIANGFEREMIVAQKIEAEKKQSEAVQLAEKVSYFASIGVIAGGVTHEINQPLNAIKVAADSLIFWDKKNSGLLPEKLLSMLNNISLSVNRMDEIIHRMRSMWVSPQKNIKEKFDLNQAVLNALTLSETHLKFQGIELKLDLHPEELPVFGIPVHIQQILLNLLSNAATSIEKGKRKIKLIEINTCTTPETVFMTVSDNGAGLPEGVNEKLFDPFFTTKKRGEGMGLGLAIVKKFVDEHGGRITAKNNQDWGAVFEVHFPAYTTTIGEMNEHNAC